MAETICSVPGVCEVEYVRGAAASAAAPELLLEVSHGATRQRHFADLRARLRGDLPADLLDFFFVNTDVGAPELARAVAARVVQQEPRRAVIVVRCLIPRTLIDCNRRIDETTVAAGSAAGEPTPGLQPWIRAPEDRRLLLDLYAAYRRVVTDAFAAVCGRGGQALLVHTYAPRSIDVPVDDRIVAALREAYAAERFGSWPLRAPVDLITCDPEGRLLASPVLADAAEAGFVAAGFEVQRNGAYTLHPATLAHGFAQQYPRQLLCLEVRRDLLVPEFTPFREMLPDPAKVARAAAPLADAALRALQ
jgi:predicted N-formylglutamate amidohydrolase